MRRLNEVSPPLSAVHTPHEFSPGPKASTACGLSGCNTFKRNVLQLSTYTMTSGMRRRREGHDESVGSVRRSFAFHGSI